MPEFVSVVRLGVDTYAVSHGNTHEKLFGGNPEQVHNWLGRHDYKLVSFAPGSWLAGTYKRPKAVAA